MCKESLYVFVIEVDYSLKVFIRESEKISLVLSMK